MELADSDEESDLLDPAVKENEEELTNLPNEWQYPELGLFSTNEDSFLVSSQVNNIAQTGPSSVPQDVEEATNKGKKTKELKKWGPILVERRSR